jgi:hypothetical protein
VIIPSARFRFAPAWLLVVAAGAAVGGAFAALHYAELGLTLTHYDARGHLVVARRIGDSLTPGWQQIGAVWLPLPHLLNAIPVQVDAWYRSGASAVAISVAAFAVAAGAVSSIVFQLTGSRASAVAGTAVFALNPNVVYLQATPMTEPLLMALTALAVAVLMSWAGAARASGAVVGWIFALACLTRYEAWPITAVALVAALFVRWRRGEPLAEAAGRVSAIALYPAATIAAFLAFSRVVIGVWLFPSGFFVPENEALGDPLEALAQVAYGIRGLSGSLVAVGALGTAALAVLAAATRAWSQGLIALSLLAAAALPWFAFVEGHPFRIRYMVPLIVVEAVGAGVAVDLIRRAMSKAGVPSAAAAIAFTAAAAYDLRPLDATAPIVVEAQWDRPNTPVRDRVTACLGSPGSGDKIMASMGSLGHYMQEASRSGFELRDFLHEGNGDIWLEALEYGPRRFAEWVLIEEQAEGGDMLAARAREDPRFLDGYVRVCEGAGLALYGRKAATTGVTDTNGVAGLQ